MRAVLVERHGEPGDALALVEIGEPTPGPGEAVLEVEAAALNLPDVLLCRGGYVLRPPLPFTPGLDAGGRIAAVGPGVDPALVGARVIAVAGGAEKTRRCLELGADAAIDHRATPDVAAAVRELTDGRGAELVVDPVGGESFEQARRCVAVDGRILVVGFASGGVPSVALHHVLMKSYAVVGVYVGGYAGSDAGRALVQRTHAAVMELLAGGRIHPVIERRIGLDGVAAALTDLAARRIVGKIVVLI